MKALFIIRGLGVLSLAAALVLAMFHNHYSAVAAIFGLLCMFLSI